MNKKIQNAINKQINAELYSAYLYLSMSAYCDSLNLKGFSHWLKKQAQEETEHGMKLYDYVVEKGGRVLLAAIDAPQEEWESILDVFDKTLKHEQKVTGLINNLVELAKKEDDKEAEDFLLWFVKEQVEEEESAGKMVALATKAIESEEELKKADDEAGSRGKK